MPKNKRKTSIVDKIKQSRNRKWEIKPFTKVVPNKKKDKDKKACRGKTGEE